MEPNSKYTILSIDDEELYRQMIDISLVFQGMKVIAAESGMKGLSLARSAKPDLILLDLVMPELDGVSVCRQIMADSTLRKIPVVVLSGSHDSDEIEACLQMGAVDYLLKPFEPRLLGQVVQKHLNAKKSA